MAVRRRAMVLGGGAVAVAVAVALLAPAPVIGGMRDDDAIGKADQGKNLQARLDGVTAAGAPGAVGRLEDGSRHWARASGVVELGRPAPLSPEARFRVGSVTKTFVAAVVLQLADEGRIGLDEPVADDLPGLLPYGEPITARQLLGHRSGLPDYAADPSIFEGARANRVFRPEELVATGVQRPLSFPPGTAFEYSNTNYVVAGLLVERLTGNTLGEELERRLLGPLGLGHTFFPATSAEIPGVSAHGYVMPGPGEPLLDVTGINPSHAWAAGALVSTAGDVARFFQALLGGDVLSPSMLAAMRTTSPVPGDPGLAYGLGLARVDTPCGPFWGNRGEIWGYHAWSFRSEDGAHALTELASLMPRPDAVNEALDGVHSLLCEG